MKTFGGVRALAGVDLHVPEGTVLGLLGPNGAGKTSTVRVLTTLLRPDAGRAFVAGVDVLRHPDKVRGLIGLSGQYAAVDEYLTGTENLRMVGELYQMTTREAKVRAKELIEWFNLGAAADRPAKTYSGGMRRRLDLAAALVVRPPVMFLDEPTTGLDPHNRIALWEVMESLADQGSTILLTTQYLEEADRLADDIAVVDKGEVIARGSSDELKARVGNERVEIVVRDRDRIAATVEAITGVATAGVVVDRRTGRITVPVDGGAPVLAGMINELECRGLRPDEICLRRPTLDEVFLSLTGHADVPDGSPAPSPVEVRAGGTRVAAREEI
ncbi:daunorubicin/doxorubicin resistance ABC transporter ATP-binding protein DrrA (plasmid) [Streptomyces cadmiisoli]|uniref:Daunorubicin/doxorubicin resistance ABC transporter ATP-binding protein DrrA n=1 Tax=Streptomyces cadmiisoli TaxID=2184053 RepID=A0A2Z4JF70_9ACTN|nr:daunorubicin/doxorubicin resistance ABC transporter ATP-binding protein DrrA [Streptomyces cadmiisoli]